MYRISQGLIKFQTFVLTYSNHVSLIIQPRN